MGNGRQLAVPPDHPPAGLYSGNVSTYFPDSFTAFHTSEKSAVRGRPVHTHQQFRNVPNSSFSAHARAPVYPSQISPASNVTQLPLSPASMYSAHNYFVGASIAPDASHFAPAPIPDFQFQSDLHRQKMPY